MLAAPAAASVPPAAVRVAGALLLAVLVFATAAPAMAAQQRPGEVAGTVVDFDGTPLAGITVQLVGPFPDNAAKLVVSDANARFVFTDIPTGLYRLSIELSGLSAGGDLDVTVRPGLRTETTLVLSLLGTQVNVVVQAEAPALADTDLSDAESTSGLRTVPGTTIERFPLPAEQALEVLPLLPTVVRGSKGQLAIDGTLPTDSVLLFNGIDLMDGYSGEYRVRMPIEAIDTVELFTGVPPSRYGNIAGGIVDVRTVPGGQSWEWGVSSFFPKPRFEDGTFRGIKNASPRFRVSGPLKSGKTFVSVAGEYHFDRVDVFDIPGNPDQDHVVEEGWNAFTQFDWRPNERHAFKVAGLVFPQQDRFAGLDGLTPPEATLNVEHDAEAILLSHAYRFDEDRALESSIQFNRIGVASRPLGTDPFRVTTDGFGGNQFHGEDRQTSHLQAQTTYVRRFARDDGSSHRLEIGADFQRLHLSGEFRNGAIDVLGAGNRRLQRIDFVGAPLIRNDKYEWAGFVQDRWTRSDRFWFDFGLRYSSDSHTNDHRLEPRFGAAWDPAGDRRTLLKGGAGLVHRRVYLGEIVWDELPVRLETTFDEDGTGTLEVFEPRLADDLDAPRTLQLSVDLSHRLRSYWMLRTKYSYRRSDNNIIAERVESFGIPVPLGVDPVDVFRVGRPIETGALTLTNDGSSRSWSLELTVARRIPTGGEFVVSYVRSSSFGDLNDFSLLASQTPAAIIRPNRRAPRAFDAPHRVVAWGTFELPLEVVITPVVEWRSGFPYSVFNEDQSYAGAPNGERFPDFFALDVQATKAFEIKGYGVIAGVKLSNITGHDNPRQVVSNLASDRFGELRNSVPLRVRARFSFRF